MSSATRWCLCRLGGHSHPACHSRGERESLQCETQTLNQQTVITLCLCDNSRFIPACAGNIVFYLYVSHQLAVHPRVCGEHAINTLSVFMTHGSSPRVRGIFICYRFYLLCERFIPACAGNIGDSISSDSISTVHPRVCGEHDILRSASSCKCGSSPRVRGTYKNLNPERDIVRFIPACAGNIAVLPYEHYNTPVHPRVCGEHIPIYKVGKC